MKKILVLMFLFCAHSSFEQTLPDFDQVKLEDGSDYKAAEPIALAATTYILSNPTDKNDINRLKSLQFIIKWMSGTPDYMFSIGKTATDLSKGNDDVMALYMACMAKFSLENKDASKDQKQIELNSVKLLLAYCENANNKIKMTKNLKKFSLANQKGELEKEMQM